MPPPDGRDIIVLSAPSHVYGLGHAAVLIGNDKTGYRYYSKNGTHGSSGASGASNKNPVKGRKYASLKEFEASADNKNDGPAVRSVWRTAVRMSVTSNGYVCSFYNCITKCKENS